LLRNLPKKKKLSKNQNPTLNQKRASALKLKTMMEIRITIMKEIMKRSNQRSQRKKISKVWLTEDIGDRHQEEDQVQVIWIMRQVEIRII